MKNSWKKTKMHLRNFKKVQASKLAVKLNEALTHASVSLLFENITFAYCRAMERKVFSDQLWQQSTRDGKLGALQKYCSDNPLVKWREGREFTKGGNLHSLKCISTVYRLRIKIKMEGVLYFSWRKSSWDIRYTGRRRLAMSM